MSSPYRKPFALPAAPVDRYEIRWWQIGFVANQAIPRPARAVYYVQAKPEEVDEGLGEGAIDFVNQWAIYEGRRLVGRTSSGWAEAWDGNHWNDCFSTWAEAVVALEARIVQRLRNARAEVEALEADLEENRALSRTIPPQALLEAASDAAEHRARLGGRS